MIVNVTFPQVEVINLTRKQSVTMNMNVTGERAGGGEAVEAFPVGSVFISVNDTDPAVLLGYGTWQSFGAGRVLAGFDADDEDFDADLKEGGDKEVAAEGTNSAPDFEGNPLPAHSHPSASAGTPQGTVSINNDTSSNRYGYDRGTMDVSKYPHSHTGSFIGSQMMPHAHGSASSGTPSGSVSAPGFTGSPSSVVQPYVVVRFWQRVA